MFKVGINQIVSPYYFQRKQITNSVKQMPVENKTTEKNNILKYGVMLLTLIGLFFITKGKNNLIPKKTNHLYRYSYTIPTRKLLEQTLKNVDLTNPEEILNALQKIPGIKIKEGNFIPNNRIKYGRKFYIMLNGEKSILEVHTNKFGKKPVLRFYENIKGRQNAHNRDYLFPDGKFRTNSFNSPDAHIPTGKDGLNWIFC